MMHIFKVQANNYSAAHLLHHVVILSFFVKIDHSQKHMHVIMDIIVCIDI